LAGLKSFAVLKVILGTMVLHKIVVIPLCANCQRTESRSGI
jgi:hypothetical protein